MSSTPKLTVKVELIRNPWSQVGLSDEQLIATATGAARSLDKQIATWQKDGTLPERYGDFAGFLFAPFLPWVGTTPLPAKLAFARLTVGEGANRGDLMHNAGAKADVLLQCPSEKSLRKLLTRLPYLVCNGGFSWPGAYRSGGIIASGSGYPADCDHALMRRWVRSFDKRHREVMADVIEAGHRPDNPARLSWATLTGKSTRSRHTAMATLKVKPAV